MFTVIVCLPKIMNGQVLHLFSFSAIKSVKSMVICNFFRQRCLRYSILRLIAVIPHSWQLNNRLIWRSSGIKISIYLAIKWKLSGRQTGSMRWGFVSSNVDSAKT